MRPGLVLLAVAAVTTPALIWATEPAVTVGITVAVSPEPDRAVLLTALRGRLEEPDLTVVEGCDEVTFCVTVVGTPVRIGRRDGGRALASYVTRRLLAHPNWPWPAPPRAEDQSSSVPVTIVDAFTAGGNVSCVDCERELEALRLQVDMVREVTDTTLVDEGDLQLHVGPATSAFLAEVATEISRGLIERHVRPWRESLRER